MDNSSQDKALTRWSSTMKELVKILEFEDIADRESLWDSLMKRVVWIKSLARDTLDLEAIDEGYFNALCEQIDTITWSLVYMKHTVAKKLLQGDSVDRVLGSYILTMLMLVNDALSMLLALVIRKLADRVELIEQGEKLKQLIQAQDKVSRERMKSYVS